MFHCPAQVQNQVFARSSGPSSFASAKAQIVGLCGTTLWVNLSFPSGSEKLSSWHQCHSVDFPLPYEKDNPLERL